jgi:diguanylate cyclase
MPVTVSIGVSAFRADDDCYTVFDRADEALYLAKRSGRNNVKTEDDVQRQPALNE